MRSRALGVEREMVLLPIFDLWRRTHSVALFVMLSTVLTGGCLLGLDMRAISTRADMKALSSHSIKSSSRSRRWCYRTVPHGYF